MIFTIVEKLSFVITLKAIAISGQIVGQLKIHLLYRLMNLSLVSFWKALAFMKNKISGKGIWEMLKQSFKGFGEDKLTKLSGSLAYCTVFSFGPLLIVIIFLSSM